MKTNIFFSRKYNDHNTQKSFQSISSWLWVIDNNSYLLRKLVNSNKYTFIYNFFPKIIDYRENTSTVEDIQTIIMTFISPLYLFILMINKIKWRM